MFFVVFALLNVVMRFNRARGGEDGQLAVLDKDRSLVLLERVLGFLYSRFFFLFFVLGFVRSYSCVSVS
jgi:hypothetical protein